MHHIIESQQFDKDYLSLLFSLTDEYVAGLQSSCLKGMILCSLFYEPSTRTRFSFESAVLKLGGKIISTEAASMFSSVVKGESLEDTIRVINGYCDGIIIRHKEDDAAIRAVGCTQVPIINAGCGKGQHPTQALLDLYTINKEFGRISGLTIALVGDLKHGRTIRSLAYLLSKYDHMRLILVSPESLRLDDDLKRYVCSKGVIVDEQTSLSEVLPLVDVVYLTRIQRERMSVEEYERVKGSYQLTDDSLSLMKESSIVMHPLPHTDEIVFSVDKEKHDRRIAYFRQAQNGLFVRMAVLTLLYQKLLPEYKVSGG